MSFTETPAAAFTASVSTISAATANTWKANIADSLDTVGGGTYTNVSTIDWLAGSAGWRFYAAVAIKSTGTLTLDAGATVTINADPSLFGTMRVGVGGAGGGVRWYATSTLTVDDTVAVSVAGDVTMTGASTLVHASGSSDTYSAGSVLAINTASATMGQDSVLTINGASGHVAQVIRGQYSTDTYQSGAGVTCNSGSLFTVGSGCFVTMTVGGGGNAGSVAWGANASQTHASGSTNTYSSGSAFTLNNGTIVNLSIGKTNAGTVTNGSLAVEVHESGSSDTYQSGSGLNLDGTTTRTGSLTLSGDGAWTALRVRAAGDPPSGDTDASKYDILEVSFLTADSSLQLDALAAGRKHQIWIRFWASAHSLQVKDQAGTNIFLFNFVAGSQQTVQFYWSGTTWRVGMVGAQTVI